MRGLFTTACVLFILPSVIGFLLWANLAWATFWLFAPLLAGIGSFIAWSFSSLIHFMMVLWLLFVVGACVLKWADSRA